MKGCFYKTNLKKADLTKKSVQFKEKYSGER